MKEMIKMYIKCGKIKELAEKIEKETLNDCEVKYRKKFGTLGQIRRDWKRYRRQDRWIKDNGI